MPGLSEYFLLAVFFRALWVPHGGRPVRGSYGLVQAYWGPGIASRALGLLLAEVPRRPLHATAAATNTASIRVLMKHGFVSTRSPEPRRGRKDISVPFRSPLRMAQSLTPRIRNADAMRMCVRRIVRSKVSGLIGMPSCRASREP
ncbi:MAG: GNAT family N-acetyltransferase, partial [Planctomycetes bacterium]|nr:GNAT family N-acetyltransferase [Planctomycetota bacterium]